MHSVVSGFAGVEVGGDVISIGGFSGPSSAGKMICPSRDRAISGNCKSLSNWTWKPNLRWQPTRNSYLTPNSSKNGSFLFFSALKNSGDVASFRHSQWEHATIGAQLLSRALIGSHDVAPLIDSYGFGKIGKTCLGSEFYLEMENQADNNFFTILELGSIRKVICDLMKLLKYFLTHLCPGKKRFSKISKPALRMILILQLSFQIFSRNRRFKPTISPWEKLPITSRSPFSISLVTFVIRPCFAHLSNDTSTINRCRLQNARNITWQKSNATK